VNRLILSAAIACAFATSAVAQTVEVKGEFEVSVKASGGDLVVARRQAREAAERDAIAAALSQNMSVNMEEPKNIKAANEIRKQLSDLLKTKFVAEGDSLTAKTTLTVDSGQIFDLAKKLGITASSAMASAKVLFLIDEYFGVGTKLDPTQPSSTEISYSHDKGSSFDKTTKASGSQSASQSESASAKESASSSSQQASSLAASRDTRVASSDQSASASREQQAIASRDRQSLAASDQRSFAARDQQAVAGRERVGVAASDGRGTSVSGARDTQIAASRDTQVAGASNTRVAAASDSQLAASSSSASSSARDARFAGSDKQAIAASSSGKAASASASESASASQSQSASAFSVEKADKGEQRDVVNYTMKQTFPSFNNAKPEEGANARIAAKLEQTVKKFGIALVSERDFRRDISGTKLLNADIDRLSKWDYFMDKASKGNFAAKYIVYGTATTHLEGKTPTGNVACSGSLTLQSTNVDTGANLVSGKINKRTEAAVDSECRDFLADALAVELAKIIGQEATGELQRAARNGESYSVSLFSRLEIPNRLKRDFRKILLELATSPDEVGDGNSEEVSGGQKAQWMVTAKGQFKSTLEDKVFDLSDKYPEAKKVSFDAQGSRIYVCLEGKCPDKKDR
jgi:hypothetical protein